MFTSHDEDHDALAHRMSGHFGDHCADCRGRLDMPNI